MKPNSPQFSEEDNVEVGTAILTPQPRRVPQEPARDGAPAAPLRSPPQPPKAQALVHDLKWDIPLHIVVTVVMYGLTSSDGFRKVEWDKLIEAVVIASLVILLRWAFVWLSRSIRIVGSIQALVMQTQSDALVQARKIDDLSASLAAQVKSLTQAPFAAANTPFGGVWGRLCYRSGGTGIVDNIDEREYLEEFLQEAARVSLTYHTIHKDSLSWFQRHDPTGEFLMSLRTVRQKVRVFLVDDSDPARRDAFARELQDHGLLNWYWSRCGSDTKTYWTTMSILRNVRGQTSTNESIDSIDKDVVVCNGQLTLRYDQTKQCLHYSLDIDRSHQPFGWVFEALQHQLDRIAKFGLGASPSAPNPERGIVFGEVQQPETPVDRAITSSRDHYALTINLPAIAANVLAIRRHLNGDNGDNDAPESARKILAVLKNDAYGLGLRELAVFLGGASPRSGSPLVDWIGVGTASEAAKLLGERLAARLLIMDGISADEATDVVANEWTPIVWDGKSIELLSRSAERQGKDVHVHVKVDTGLTRLGVSLAELPALLKTSRKHRRVVISGICSHLAHDAAAAHEQIALFDSAVRTSKDLLGHDVNETHIASSSALHDSNLFRRYAMVRVGGALLGVVPGVVNRDDLVALGLRSAITVRSEILQVRHVTRGVRISYNATPFDRDTGRIAIVRIGYADGFPSRSDATKGPAYVLIAGRTCRILGEVYMGLLTVDISDLPNNVVAGEQVTVIGESGNEEITVMDFSRAHDLRPYEILTRFGSAMPHRHILQEGMGFPLNPAIH